MSPRISKLFGSSLSAAAATLILHVGNATAGDFADPVRPIPVQQAMQEILTGAHSMRPVHRFEPHESGSAPSPADVQERTQEMLLGPSRFQVGLTEPSGRAEGRRSSPASIRDQGRLSPVDTQAAVQRMLLGVRVAVHSVS